MPRPRDFEVSEALDAAVEVFWRQGYAATSVRELCEAMGIQAGSFYAAFESKEECFRRALQRYVDVQLPALTPGPEAIRAWFRAITAASRQGKGCLLVNSAVEAPGLDEPTRDEVGRRLRALEAFFCACLQGRPSAKVDAELLATAVVGIHVLARSGAGAGKLRRVAERVLEVAGVAEG